MPIGPLPTTVTDFWRLVWQEKVKVIVMLTNVVEGGQKKCEQYWPDQEPQEYGPFTVTLADQQVFADYIVRTLNVMVRPCSFHFQFTHTSPFSMSPQQLSLHLLLSQACREKKFEECVPDPF